MAIKKRKLLYICTAEIESGDTFCTDCESLQMDAFENYWYCAKFKKRLDKKLQPMRSELCAAAEIARTNLDTNGEVELHVVVKD